MQSLQQYAKYWELDLKRNGTKVKLLQSILEYRQPLSFFNRNNRESTPSSTSTDEKNEIESTPPDTNTDVTNEIEFPNVKT